MLGDERAGGVEVVGGLEREGLDARQRALGEPGQGAGRRHLDHRGDAEVVQRLHAQVPADRAGDLGDQPLEHLAAVVDDLAVAVGDQRDPRVVGGHRPRQGAERLHGRGHVRGVERAGDLQRRSPGPWRACPRRTRRAARRCRRRRSGRRRCRWPGSARLRDRGEHLVAVAAEHRGHAGGGRRAASAIARPRSRTRTIAASAVSTRAPAAAAISPTLWPATAPTVERVGGVREQLEGGQQAGGDQQRLGHRGVADLVRVGLGAVVDQVEAGDGGQPGQAFGAAGRSSQGVRKPGVWAPWPGATSTSTLYSLLPRGRTAWGQGRRSGPSL